MSAGPPKSGHAMLVVKLAAKISLSQPCMPWRRRGRGSLLLDGAMTTMHGAVRSKKRTARQLAWEITLALVDAQRRGKSMTGRPLSCGEMDVGVHAMVVGETCLIL